MCCFTLAARPDYKGGAAGGRSPLEPIPITDSGLLPPDFVLEDPESHFIYVCRKKDEAEMGC